MSTVKTVAYFNKLVYNYLVGRDGQTIDDQTFLKNMWMEAKGVEVMLDHYKRLADDVANKEYLKKRLLYRILVIYHKCLTFAMPATFDLRKFDNWLQTNAPELYKESNELQVSALRSRFTCKFVKAWRERKLNSNLTFKFILLYDAFRKAIRRKNAEPSVVYFDK